MQVKFYRITIIIYSANVCNITKDSAISGYLFYQNLDSSKQACNKMIFLYVKRNEVNEYLLYQG